MNPKVVFAALLSLSFGCALQAQPMEPPAPGKIGLSFSGAAYIAGEGDVKNGSTTYKDISASQLGLTINQQFLLSKMRRLGLALEYEQTDIHKPTSTQVPLPDQLQALGVSARYLQLFNPQWMLSVTAGVGSYVADTGLLSEGWGIRASAIGIYNYSRQFTFIFGLAHNSLTEDLLIVPVVGFDWRPNEKWSVAFGFPRIGVTYKLNKEVALGFGVSGSGGAFYVKDDPLPGTAPRSLDDSRLQHLEIRVGVNCDWKINDTFRVSGTVGSVVMRRLKYIERDYELKSSGTAPFVALTGTLSL
jgi:hypothetical protein